MIPKTSPGGLQRIQNADQKRCSIGALISSDFLKPKWALKRVQKSLEDEVFRDLGAPGPPEASRKPPGSHFVAFWDSFLQQFWCQNSTANLNIDSKPLPRVVALPACCYFRASGPHFQLFSHLRSSFSGSVAGLWRSPLEIRPRSPCGSLRGRERSDLRLRR